MNLIFLISFFISLLLNFFTLFVLKKTQAIQFVRIEGPKNHYHKNGIPTMGGIGIIFTIIILTYFLHSSPSSYNLALSFLLVSFGIIGFSDDFLKIFFKNNKGFKGRQKLLGQILASFVFSFALVQAGHYLAVDPLSGFLFLNNAWIYFFFASFVVIASSNALNLSDGLDGLAAGLITIIFTTYAFIAIKYGLLDIAVFALVVSATCLSFLVFNFNPAKIFMGDVGSLALGAIMGGFAMLTHTYWLLILIAIVPILETVSVIIQVFYFKISKGKRFFKMTPLHHHFELSGFLETQIVFFSWLITIIACLIAFVLA